MPGSNCAFYGCPTSRRYEHYLFKIPVCGAGDGEHTAALKKKARDEWLRLILRTREMTQDLRQQIEANNVYICELHFKPDCILTRKYIYFILFYAVALCHASLVLQLITKSALCIIHPGLIYLCSICRPETKIIGNR